MRRQKKNEVKFCDIHFLLESACWQKPNNYYKGKNHFHFCSFPFTRASEIFCVLNEAEMNNVHYSFNNSCICSVPCLFP